jgi:hypothetical protein
MYKLAIFWIILDHFSNSLATLWITCSGAPFANKMLKEVK